MGTKIFLAAIAQPNAQNIGNFRFLFLGKRVVKRDRAIAFSPTGGVVVGIPIAAGNPNPPTDFFNQCIPRQGILLLRHTKILLADAIDPSLLAQA